MILFKKELANVEQALNGFLSAIAAGIVTKSTKERMLSLEAQKEELENKIELEKQRDIPPLKYETVRAFLTYFANKEYKSDEEKNEFFNSFIYRVVLFDDYIYIFYNTSPEYPTKVKLEKDELQALYTLRDNTVVTTDCGKDKKPEMHPVEKDLGNKKAPCLNRQSSNWVLVAEKQGFEPWLRFTRTTPLAGEPLRPLGYFSKKIINRIFVCQGAFCRLTWL